METLLPEKVYRRLKQGLFAGEFLAGERLDYQRLATELGVSTTPIREAMAKLASEGLVTLVPRAGANVCTPSPDELAQLFDVREAIESHAAALAAERISPAVARQIGELVTSMELQLTRAETANAPSISGDELAEFMRYDFAFHMTIIEASGNRKLVRIAGESAAHARIFCGARLPYSIDLLRESNEAHAAIFRAIEQRDVSSARELVRQHIRRSLELMLALETSADRNNWMMEASVALA